MTEYSDNACSVSMGTKSYTNGQQIENSLGQCITTLQCSSASSPVAVVPTSIPYGIVQFYGSGTCYSDTYFHAMINNVCIQPSTTSTSTFSGYKSMKMIYPNIYQYSSTSCTGTPYISSVTQVSCDYASSSMTTKKGEQKKGMFYTPVVEDMSLSQSIDHISMLMTELKAKDQETNNLRAKQIHVARNKEKKVEAMNAANVDTQDATYSYFYATDDYWNDELYTSVYLVNGPPTFQPTPGPTYDYFGWDDDISFTLSKGAIAGIVIGAICGCGIICAMIYFVVLCLFGVEKAMTKSKAPVEAQATSMEMNGGVPIYHNNPILATADTATPMK